MPRSCRRMAHVMLLRRPQTQECSPRMPPAWALWMSSSSSLTMSTTCAAESARGKLHTTDSVLLT